METFKINYGNKNGVSEVEFNGQLNINNIEAITKDLKGNLKLGTPLSIIIREIESLDVAFLQLIYSLKINCEKEGYDIKISADIPKDLKQSLINSGFSDFINN